MPRSDDYSGFLAGCRRYGVFLAVQRVLLHALHRLFDFELCRTGHSNLQTDPAIAELPPGYKVRYVNNETFNRLGARTLAEVPGTSYDWAFQRGDQCIAALYNNEIVAWNFQSDLPTRVRPGLLFHFGPQFVYSYGSYTSINHRGKRLSSACYTLPRRLRLTLGMPDRASTYYINMANLASRATDGGTENEAILLGYSLYIKTRNGYFCWNSRGCCKHDSGFAMSKKKSRI